MIKNYSVAKELIEVLDDCSSKINETIRLVQEECTDEEFQVYRKAAGFVMGYIYTDVVAPLYKEHPELEPPELTSDDEQK
jgi:hypothetical protein